MAGLEREQNAAGVLEENRSSSWRAVLKDGDVGEGMGGLRRRDLPTSATQALHGRVY